MPTYDYITVLGCAAKLTVTTFDTTAAEQTYFSEALPSGILNVIGRNVRCRAWGTYGTDAVTPGTIQVQFKYGSTVLLNATSATLPGAETNRGWMFECDVTTITTGASGTVEAQGRFWYAQGSLDNPKMLEIRNTAVITVDVTGVVTPTLTMTRSVSDAQNTTSCRIGLLDVGGLV